MEARRFWSAVSHTAFPRASAATVFVADGQGLAGMELYGILQQVNGIHPVIVRRGFARLDREFNAIRNLQFEIEQDAVDDAVFPCFDRLLEVDD